MKKSSRIILNVMTVVVLNFVFWLSNYYPRHLIERLPVLGIMNFLYFIIYFSVLIVIFGRERSIFDKNIFNKALPWYERFALAKLMILMLCQLTFDLIGYISDQVFDGGVNAIIQVVLVAAWWIAVYMIITWKKKQGKKGFAVVCSAVVLLAIIGAVMTCVVSNNSLYMHSKFEADSEYLIQYVRNTDWINGIILFVIDCIIGGILVGYCTYNKAEDDTEENWGQISLILIRIVIIVVVGWLLVALKIWIYPVGSINNIHVSSRDTEAKYNVDKFFEKYNLKDVYRVDEHGEPIIVYSKHTRYIDYYTSRMLTIHTTESDPAYSYDMSEDLEENDAPNVIYIPYNFSDYNISGEVVELYANSVICYKENGVPYTVMLSELDEYGEHELVVKACKEFLEEGNIALFEYCCDYLLKYDRGFMETYIDRIAKGDFTEAELEVFAATKIRREFVMDIARNRLDASEN